MMWSQPSNAATMFKWLESSSTASGWIAAAAADGASGCSAPLATAEDEDEGRGRDSRHMMHWSGSDMVCWCTINQGSS
jgi:hypothetical protein